MRLIQLLAQHGLRVFSRHDIHDILKENSLSPSYSLKILHVMSQRKELQSLGCGLYALPTELLAGNPIHEFEIAMKIAPKGAISHRSAMFFHKMTDQMLHCVYICAENSHDTQRFTRKTYKIYNTTFNIRRVQKQKFYGAKRFFIGETAIWVTNKEKTLIDGLSCPNLCGGFREVMNAFEHSIKEVDPQILLQYAQKEPIVVAKRLGWILEQINVLPDIQECVEKVQIHSIQKLNPSGSRQGHINKKWMLWENL